MDGVLYDSMPNHAKAWSQAMNDFGIDMTPHEVYMNEGSTGTFTIKQISLRKRGREATDDECRLIYKHKAELFQQLPPAGIMPGALDVMRKAREHGMQIQIVTGSGQQVLIDRVLTDFKGYITRDLMVTSMDVSRGKPYPDPYLKGLETGHVDASCAVVVENAPLGVRAAVAAGIETIAVNTGPLDDSVLMAEGAVRLFPSMKALALDWDSLY